MKRMALVLIFLPLTLAAQEPTAGGTRSQAEVANPAPAQAASTDAGLSASLVTDPDRGSPTDPTAEQQPNAKPAQASPSGENRPRLPGSMVGYIDNPIPESQIRIRFDGAFHNQFPDRAEFFYGKCGCYRAVGLDPNAPGPPPGSTASAIPNNLNFQQLYIQAEFSPTRRFSLFTEIPVRWIEPEGSTISVNGGTFPNQSGLGDVTAGFKLAAVASESSYITFQFTGYFPSGDASKGLGTNHYSVEPAVLFYHRLSDRMTLEGEVGDRHPIGGSAGENSASSEGFAGDVFYYGVGPSYTVYSGRRVAFTPVLEVVGWHVLSGFQTQLGGPFPAGVNVASEVGGTDILNIKIGARTTVGPHNSFYVGYGHSVTSADWYDQIVRVEYRYTF
jgi:Putative MetA-pathway of phenol degradation